MFDVHEEFAPLHMLVGLSFYWRPKGGARWHWRKLVEVAAQDFGRHAAPCLGRFHVCGRVEVMAEASAVRLSQGVGV